MSLFGALDGVARRRPEAPCLLGERGCDWAGFMQRVLAVAQALAAYNGRVVVLAGADGPEFATVLVGTLLSGAIALPLPPGATPFEESQLLADLDVGYRLDVSTGFPAAEPGWSPTAPEPGAVAVLLATSGSTASPRRVALTQAGLLWNARAHAESLGLPVGVRTLVTGSLAHAFPLVAVLLATLLQGGALAWLAGAFTPRAFARQTAELAIGYAAVPPALLALLVARLAPGAALPGVLSVGAAAVDAAALQTAVAWAAASECRLYHTYGLTEAGPRVSTLAPEDVALKAHTVGRPFDGIRVRTSSQGEIELSTPSAMHGYHPDGGGLTDDGWVATGDLGGMDADGFLRVTGRLKDVIVTGGVSVAAAEIEAALKRDDRVDEAAVIGVASAAYGEVPWAFVVAREPLSAAELQRHLESLLSRPKWPHRFEFIDALPRTLLGKVDKRALRALAIAALTDRAPAANP